MGAELVKLFHAIGPKHEKSINPINGHDSNCLGMAFAYDLVPLTQALVPGDRRSESVGGQGANLSRGKRSTWTFPG